MWHAFKCCNDRLPHNLYKAEDFSALFVLRWIQPSVVVGNCSFQPVKQQTVLNSLEFKLHKSDVILYCIVRYKIL